MAKVRCEYCGHFMSDKYTNGQFLKLPVFWYSAFILILTNIIKTKEILFMILEVKDSKNYVSVYGYDDVYDWLNDIVQAYETGELLDDFIPEYLSVKIDGQYLSIVDEGNLEHG